MKKKKRKRDYKGNSVYEEKNKYSTRSLPLGTTRWMNLLFQHTITFELFKHERPIYVYFQFV